MKSSFPSSHTNRCGGVVTDIEANVTRLLSNYRRESSGATQRRSRRRPHINLVPKPFPAVRLWSSVGLLHDDVDKLHIHQRYACGCKHWRPRHDTSKREPMTTMSLNLPTTKCMGQQTTVCAQETATWHRIAGCDGQVRAAISFPSSRAALQADLGQANRAFPENAAVKLFCMDHHQRFSKP